MSQLIPVATWSNTSALGSILWRKRHALNRSQKPVPTPLYAGRLDPKGRRKVFTRDILFGMNILTLAGFAVMGLSLTLRRMARTGVRLSIGLMCAGTALVFLGLYAGSSSN